MTTRIMDHELEELKSYFNIRFNEQKEGQIKKFNNIIADNKEIQHEV